MEDKAKCEKTACSHATVIIKCYQCFIYVLAGAGGNLPPPPSIFKAIHDFCFFLSFQCMCACTTLTDMQERERAIIYETFWWSVTQQMSQYTYINSFIWRYFGQCIIAMTWPLLYDILIFVLDIARGMWLAICPSFKVTHEVDKAVSIERVHTESRVTDQAAIHCVPVCCCPYWNKLRQTIAYMLTECSCMLTSCYYRTEF